MSKKMLGLAMAMLTLLLVTACGSDDPVPLEDQAPLMPGNPTVGEPVLSIVDGQPTKFNLPNVLIIIDDSSSMTDKDKAGDACDQSGLRYKLGYFFLNVINDWKTGGLINSGQQTTVWFLDGDVPYRQADDPHRELLDRIENGDDRSGSISGLSEIFAETTPGLQKTLLHDKLNNDSLILFITDGDFRIERMPDENWFDAKERVFTGVEQLALQKNISAYFFLLCPRRLADSNLDGEVNELDTMLSFWRDSFPLRQGHIYGIDDGDFTIQRDLVQKLPEVLTESFSDLLAKYDSSGEIKWNIITGEDYGTEIDAKTLKFFAGGTSYNAQPALTFPSLPLLHFFDSGNPPFPCTITSSDGCDPHYFLIPQVKDFALAWWQAVPINFTILDNAPLVFYNDSSINMRIDIPSGMDWSRWRNCLLFKVKFSADLSDVIASFEDDQSGHHILKIPAPQDGNIFQEHQLTLSLFWDKTETEIQSFSFPYERRQIPLFSGASQPENGKIDLFFAFLPNPGYGDVYQPTLYFPDDGCNLNWPNYYKPVGTPFHGITFTSYTDRYEIEFLDGDYSQCKNMELKWVDWPYTQDTELIPATVVCQNLDWSEGDLVHADCK